MLHFKHILSYQLIQFINILAPYDTVLVFQLFSRIKKRNIVIFFFNYRCFQLFCSLFQLKLKLNESILDWQQENSVFRVMQQCFLHREWDKYSNVQWKCSYHMLRYFAIVRRKNVLRRNILHHYMSSLQIRQLLLCIFDHWCHENQCPVCDIQSWHPKMYTISNFFYQQRVQVASSWLQVREQTIPSIFGGCSFPCF